MSSLTKQEHKAIKKIVLPGKNPDQYLKVWNKRVFIWLAKKPLMENKCWYWYQWVLLQSADRMTIQCSVCWQWVHRLTNWHLKMHWLTAKEYKEKYWLFLRTWLISDYDAAHLAKTWLKNLKIGRATQKASWARNKLYTKEISERRQEWMSHARKCMEALNKAWTCEAQIWEQLKEFILNHRMMPNQNTRWRMFCYLLRQRYWSTNKWYEHYGLPKKFKVWPKCQYVFTDWTIYTWSMSNETDRETIFDLMLEKCNLLTN